MVIRETIYPALILLCISMFLFGCTTAKGTFCQIASPIRLSDASVDALSDAEVAQLLSHNRKGAELCAWKS